MTNRSASKGNLRLVALAVQRFGADGASCSRLLEEGLFAEVRPEDFTERQLVLVLVETAGRQR